MTDWSRFDAAIERARPTLWWRDDDAIADTPALHRLMALADTVESPLTLAVIPGNLTGSLRPAISGRNINLAAHGWKHKNHAPSGEKSAEFGAHRPLEMLTDDAARGRSILDEEFGPQALPLFIPPWNRVAAELELSPLGYSGISIFGHRERTQFNGLTRLDAHIDPIDWRGTRSALPAQAVVDQIVELLSSEEPIGLMTHHLVHDDAIWALTEQIVTRLTKAGGKWISVENLLTRAEE